MCVVGESFWRAEKRAGDAYRSTITVRKQPRIARCRGCGCVTTVLTQHHLRPRAMGGDDHPGNIIHLCLECHDFVEQVIPLPWTRSGVINACMERGAAKVVVQSARYSGKECWIHGDWHLWVYGGYSTAYAKCICPD